MNKLEMMKRELIIPLKEYEIKYIKFALVLCNNNKTEVAKLLGISLKTIYNKLKLKGNYRE